MVCFRCHGTGSIERTVTKTGTAEWICPECMGNGITSCCEVFDASTDWGQAHAEEMQGPQGREKEVRDDGNT